MMELYSEIPSYAKNRYNLFFLMKFFQSKDNLDYFLNGKLYMRSHTDFSDKSLGDGRSDILDGANFAVIPINENSYPEVKFKTNDKGQICVETFQHDQKPDDYHKPVFIRYSNENQQRNLFCMYTLWINSVSNDICCISKDMLSKFGEYGVIITNIAEFLNRVACAGDIDPTVEKMHSGFVNYIEKDQAQNVMDINPYQKFAEGYSYQNEFRICAETNNKNLLELSLPNDLNDISIPINTKTFIETLKIESGKLCFNPGLSYQNN